MKIIKPGSGARGWSKKVTCTGGGNGGGGCKAVLEVDESDLYETESSARGETTTYTTFMCAACGVETDIDAPYEVQARIKPLSPSARETRRRKLLAAGSARKPVAGDARERLRRMAAEIEYGAKMAETSLPAATPTSLGAFGVATPAPGKAQQAIEAARDDAAFLRQLADSLEMP